MSVEVGFLGWGAIDRNGIRSVARIDRAGEFERREIERGEKSAFNREARRIFGLFARTNVWHPRAEEAERKGMAAHTERGGQNAVQKGTLLKGIR